MLPSNLGKGLAIGSSLHYFRYSISPESTDTPGSSSSPSSAAGERVNDKDLCSSVSR